MFTEVFWTFLTATTFAFMWKVVHMRMKYLQARELAIDGIELPAPPPNTPLTESTYSIEAPPL